MTKVKDPVAWRESCKRLMASTEMMPGRGRLLVARDPRSDYLSQEKVLLATDASKEQKQTGAVLLCGPKRENAMGSEVDYVFQPGDKVLFNQYGGKPLQLHGLELVILEEAEIFLRMNKAALEA